MVLQTGFIIIGLLVTCIDRSGFFINFIHYYGGPLRLGAERFLMITFFKQGFLGIRPENWLMSFYSLI